MLKALLSTNNAFPGVTDAYCFMSLDQGATTMWPVTSKVQCPSGYIVPGFPQICYQPLHCIIPI